MRKFLIAYNINLVATKEQAHRIALNLRSQGRKDMPGRLKAVQVVVCQINIFFHPLTRYTYRVLQTIQMELILLCVRAEPAVLGSTKTALKFKYENLSRVTLIQFNVWGRI